MYPETEPGGDESGEQDDDSLLNQLGGKARVHTAKRGPGKPEALVGERGEELDAQGVRRERVETGMGEQREAQRDGNRSAVLRPRTAKEDRGRSEQRAGERERERMCDGAMGEGRGIREVQGPADHIDVRQSRACRGGDAHSNGGPSGLDPGPEGIANGGMGERCRHGVLQRPPRTHPSGRSAKTACTAKAAVIWREWSAPPAARRA